MSSSHSCNTLPYRCSRPIFSVALDSFYRSKCNILYISLLCLVVLARLASGFHLSTFSRFNRNYAYKGKSVNWSYAEIKMTKSKDIVTAESEVQESYDGGLAEITNGAKNSAASASSETVLVNEVKNVTSVSNQSSSDLELIKEVNITSISDQSSSELEFSPPLSFQKFLTMQVCD